MIPSHLVLYKRKERSNASVPGGEIKDQTLYNNSSPLYTCMYKAYSRGNWIIVTVRFRDRSNNMIELDSRLTTNFMTSTCREAKIAVSTNFEDIMMARFTSTL
ncbi:hypothetical protein Y032_0666g1334 [Ancylostoma ceylanicum]|uniref:Uncharacterized protein n=1 Tax=Ancylostoma ceylanicum TaxID=53326 RepID=A0A016WJQ2_9BILA|nr:hypothetical protein Y032_0666g1334 [Ancylostoma ceylanicum]